MTKANFSLKYLLSGCILPEMTLSYVWNWINPAALGNIYRNTPGLAKGNILLINGEGVFGTFFACIFAVWIVLRFRGKKE
jgi:hypothetical protein